MSYVCICNPTTDLQIKEKVLENKSLKQVIQELHICKDCKTCAKEIVKIYNTYKK